MKITMPAQILAIAVFIAVLSAAVCLFVLVVKALIRYIGSKDVREERTAVKQALGEVLKAHRERCKMTQEFVAEAIGVSRQAVSKWETGVSHN